MNLRELRGEAPEWRWRAERHGFGWRYVGRRGGRRVVVQAYSVLCGPGEDDAETQWRVDDGRASATYAAWWISQHAAFEADKRGGEQ